MARLNAVKPIPTDFERGAILVVEDDVAVRELMKTCLEIQGFDVITAGNGLEGLRRYKENKDRVQIVVTDLEMPAMNGSDMIQQIFRIAPLMKVIVASGHTRSYTRSNKRSPRTRCLQKPYTARELTDAVNLLSRFH
jgi:DNA-binding NtrC family response regulator